VFDNTRVPPGPPEPEPEIVTETQSDGNSGSSPSSSSTADSTSGGAGNDVPAPSSEGDRGVWSRLADCESGNWVNGGESFEPGSARWHWAKPGTEVPPWGTTIHHGGLQFHPGTWSSFKLDGYPQYAYDATPAQQIAVAERVLAAQGWGAWPTCASKLGLR
jgi:resuscitation-promoting factor RpfB